MPQKNLLLLILSCPIIFVTIEATCSIGGGGGGGGHGILGQVQGEDQEISSRSLGRVTSFSALNLKSPPPLSPQ